MKSARVAFHLLAIGLCSSADLEVVDLCVVWCWSSDVSVDLVVLVGRLSVYANPAMLVESEVVDGSERT